MQSFVSYHKFTRRPRSLRSGEVAFFTKKSLVRRRDETAIILSLITNRRLFGEIFFRLDATFFFQMRPESGVFIRPIVPTHAIVSGCNWPSDIDLLIIPYENDRLLLHRTVAIEVKIIRASFLKQGKSPNEFGFSQAEGLRNLGFPYTAVAHFIVSDKGPPSSWTTTSVFRVLDEAGNVEALPNQLADMMPSRLLQRSFGRLVSRCTDKNTGLIAAYIGSDDEDIAGMREDKCLWMPQVRKSKFNKHCSSFLLENVAIDFDRNYELYFDNPRFDPPSS